MVLRGADSGRDRTVFLHVGSPQAGTALVQTTLWERRDELARSGITYPLEHPGEHFDVAMDVRRAPWGGRWDPAWDDAWGKVAARITSAPQRRAVVSSELLGAATRPQVAGMVAAVAPADVHVVFTARDVSRALASDWQEQLKHTHTVTFDRFVDDLVTLGREAPAPFGEMFWGLHDPAAVLAPWAEVVGADKVHVVTVPRSGDRDELWRRFAAVVGIGPSVARESGEGDTPLGVVEAELLRRLNEQGPLEKRLTWMYDGLARLELAEWILARRTSARPITLPERHRAWADERDARTVAAIEAAGYDVVGSVDDLRPSAGDTVDGDPPSELTDGELLDASIETLAALLLRLGVVQNPPR